MSETPHVDKVNIRFHPLPCMGLTNVTYKTLRQLSDYPELTKLEITFTKT